MDYLQLEEAVYARNTLIGMGLRYKLLESGWYITAPGIEVLFTPCGIVQVNAEVVPAYRDVVPRVQQLISELHLNTLQDFREEVGDEQFMLYSIASLLALSNTLDYHVNVVKEDPVGRLKNLFLTKYQELKNKCGKFNQYFQSLFNLAQHDALNLYTKQLYEINLCLGLMDPRDRDKVELLVKELLQKNYDYSKFKLPNK